MVNLATSVGGAIRQQCLPSLIIQLDSMIQLVFPLQGAHLSVMCTDCHKDADKGHWKGLNTACVSCHYSDYKSTKNPDHTLSGFSTDCLRCHNETEGFNSSFDHGKSGFPLTGAHQNLSCAECHKNNVFSGLPTACVSCHLTNYQQTTSPNHILEGYPQQCEECHTTASWKGEFIHRSFPIYSGNHAGKWSSCSDCHNVPGSYNQFTCFTCHSPNTHSRTYTSTQCYNCHPTGRGED
jgi:hypothetical protein